VCIMSPFLEWDEQEMRVQLDDVLQRFPAWNK
jgi:hypothetical protein